MNKIYSLMFLLSLVTTFGFSQWKNWALPDFGVIQYAGSIGYFSAGLGYDVFKSKARFSTHFGYVPKKQGGNLNVLAIKLLFKPVSLRLGNRLQMNPVDFGLMGSYHYGDNFETRWPEGVHPKGYYWWNPALRAHLAMETSVTYEFRKEFAFRSIMGYLEFNTNELYFISLIQNIKTVNAWDVIKIGAGTRVNF